MTKTRIVTAAAALLLSAPFAGSAAPSAEELNQRLTVLERRLDSATLVEMSNDMQALREEVQRLRGDLDVVKRQIKEIKQRQRDLYKDVDTRLQELENSSEQDDRAPSIIPPDAVPVPPDRESDGNAPAGGDTSQQGNNGDQPNPSIAYKQAFDTLKAGRYREAGEMFGSFVDQFPDSAYADNARYWLGESFYVVRAFDDAMTHFQALLDDYPESAKRSDALLKIGFIHYEKGNIKEARETLEKVQDEYPDSTAASLATERLARIDREN